MSARRYSCILLLATSAVWIRAEEKSPPPAPPPASDGISSAKRDFDGLKNSRTTLEQQKLDVPQVSSPTLHLTDEYSNFTQAEAAEKKERDAKKGKSDNWLVDAMQEKPESGGKKLKPAEAFKAPDEDREQSTLLKLNDEESARLASKNSENNSKGLAPADNPLTGYMSSWMTPKDYDLLKVKPAETNDTPTISLSIDRGSDPALLGGLMRTNASASAAHLPVGVSAERPANPYLTDFGPLPAAPTKEFNAPPLSASIDLGPSLTPQPARKGDQSPPLASPTPVDLLKPSTDSKYFPQLKRF